MATLQHRRGIASLWTSQNPVLNAGEIGYETDTGKHKIGNGATAWSSLPYFVPESKLPLVIERNEGTGTWPLRSTATSSAATVVMWIGSVAPAVGGGYMIAGKDVVLLRTP